MFLASFQATAKTLEDEVQASLASQVVLSSHSLTEDRPPQIQMKIL
jgi:hypothetical protein